MLSRQFCQPDLGELYCDLAGRLEHIVRLDVTASDAVIEDACQFAWSRLVHHRERVGRDGALSWLARTAVHEAFKLIRRDARELSLDAPLDARTEGDSGPVVCGPDELFEQHERLRAISTLPARQQRLLWLQAFGLSYQEIAARERCTQRTVERQLLRARDSLRARAAQ